MTVTAPALEVRDLWFWYEPGRPVLRGIDLVIAAGQFVALVGANGSGKTTLAKQMNGLLRSGRGAVTVMGKPVAGRPVGDVAWQVGFLFQHPEQQIFNATVREEVAFGPTNLGLAGDEVEARVEAALERFALAHVAERPPAILSYGARRRVTLASLAAMDPPILVLDEPTVGLDAGGLEETFGWLGEMHARGRTILLVTHDMELVAQHAQRAVVLHEGRIVADDRPAAIFQRPELIERASLDLPPVAALAAALAAPGMGAGVMTVEAFVDAYAALAGSMGREPML
ncbi:MAG: ABC transporter ATP-binding protein [Anaerolineae bacterium]|nr:ABC transporter ATP-binding protein [Anaerolineae bacterium]